MDNIETTRQTRADVENVKTMKGDAFLQRGVLSQPWLWNLFMRKPATKGPLYWRLTASSWFTPSAKKSGLTIDQGCH